MPTTGLARGTAAADPLSGADPNGMTAPPLVTNQYPSPSAGTAMPTTVPVAIVGPSWHGAKWFAVASSVALARLQVVSSRNGAVHDTTRQAMRPTQAMS